MTNLAFIDGPGTAPAGPLAQPQTHVVGRGESLAAVADRYGVTPQAVRDANPQIFRHIDRDRREEASLTGDVLFDGDVLNIPAAPMSVTEDPVKSDSVSPGFPSSNSEYGVGNVTFNPGDGTIKLSVEQQKELLDTHKENPFGIEKDTSGVKVELVNKREFTTGFVNKGGNTEVSVEFVADVSLKGSAEAGGKGGLTLDANAGAGTRFKYKVILPGENQNPARAATIDPTDPSTIPDGATVTMDGQNYVNSGFGASFRYVAARANRLDASGLTYSITRNGDQVSVLTGPTRVIESFVGAGVRVGDVSAIVGRQDVLSDAKLQAATFDIGNPDSASAYEHFLLTGQVAHATPGVSHVATIERLDASSQTRAKIEAGPINIDLAGAQTTGSFVRVEYPDGSSTQTFDFKQTDLMNRVPVQITSRFDPGGNEIASERTYRYSIDTRQEGTAELLNMALNGGIHAVDGPVKPGSTVTLTFTEAQMQHLMTQTGTTRNAYQIPSQGDRVGRLLGGPNYSSQPATSASFAVRMSTMLGSDPYGFADRLVEIARGADGNLFGGGLQPIEATVS